MIVHELFGVGVVRPDPNGRPEAKSHPYHEIIVITEGRMLLNPETDPVVAEAGDILFYRAGFVHEENSDLKNPFGSLYLSFGIKDPLPWLPLRTRDTTGRIRHLLEWIMEDERAQGPSQMRGLFLEVILSELRRLYQSSSNPWLENILAFIRENLAQPLTLDDLACQGRLGKFAFARKFKQLTGRTPMEELRLARLDQAQTLLLTTDLPVKAIAPAVGLGNESSLSKLFRRYLNISPSDLRGKPVNSIAP